MKRTSFTIAILAFATMQHQAQTVTDIDGNSYNYISYGSQIWMKENLKTTRYSNGNAIGTTTPAALNIASESTPKYQWAYNGNESNVATYGRLYSWFAVTDARNVCPTGWKVPSTTDWTTFSTYLTNNGYGYGGSGNDIGKSTASTSLWNSHALAGNVGNNQSANNSSGFTAIPGGGRLDDGSFILMGIMAGWWSSSENIFNTTKAWGRDVYYDSSTFYSGFVNKKFAFSIRCINDSLLTGSLDSINFVNTGGTTPMNIFSNIGYTITPNQAWINVNATSGSGYSTINITAAANSMNSIRTGTVVLAKGTKIKTVKITQDSSASVLTVSSDSIHFINTGGGNSFNIVSNRNYTITPNQAWITVNATTGNGNSTVNVTASNNAANTNRVGTITVTGGDIVRVVKITQDSSASVLTVSSDSIHFINTGGSNSFNIVSNRNYTITPNQAWITVNATTGNGNSTVNITASNNAANTNRAGSITITGGAIVRVVKITQDSSSSIIPIVQKTIMTEVYTVYPNPSSSSICIQSSESMNHESRGFLYNQLGQELITFILRNNEPSTIDLFNYANGIYMVVIRQMDGQCQFIKVVKE